MKDLLKFLFTESQQREEIEDILDESFTAMLEQAAKEEDTEMGASKSSLSAALKEIGLKCCKEGSPGDDGKLCLDNREEYAEAVRSLSDPETMHKLATKGWVAMLGGDVAMHNEEPCFIINFLEIKTADTGDAEKADKMKTVLKNAREFATTELERDDDNNPVDSTDDGITKVKLPKAKDGETPDSVKESKSAQELADHLLEGGKLFKQKKTQKVKLAKKK